MRLFFHHLLPDLHQHITTPLFRTFASETTQFLAPFEASVRQADKEGTAGVPQPDHNSQVRGDLSVLLWGMLAFTTLDLSPLVIGGVVNMCESVSDASVT